MTTHIENPWNGLLWNQQLSLFSLIRDLSGTVVGFSTWKDEE